MLAYAPGESESSTSTGGYQEAPAVTAALTAAGAFDPDALTADDEARYQHLKRAVAELDDPPLFLRRYRTLR